MANVVGERYQITIDRHVRDELGVNPGDLAVERVEDGRLVIEFVPKPHRRSLYGALRRPGQQPIADWRAVKEAAWTARTAEITEVLDRSRSDGLEDPRPSEPTTPSAPDEPMERS